MRASARTDAVQSRGIVYAIALGLAQLCRDTEERSARRPRVVRRGAKEDPAGAYAAFIGSHRLGGVTAARRRRAGGGGPFRIRRGHDA